MISPTREAIDGVEPPGYRPGYQLNINVQEAAIAWQYAELALVELIDTRRYQVSYETARAAMTITPMVDRNTHRRLMYVFHPGFGVTNIA